ncbi:MAG: AMP phosphorylase [Thermosphaera sp.]
MNVLDLNFGKPTIIINDKDAQELGITPGNILMVIHGDKQRTGVAVTTRTMTTAGAILISSELAQAIGLKGDESVGLKPLSIPPSFPALKRRLKGERLEESDYREIVRDIVSGVYGEAEIAAFLVSQLFYEPSEDELTYLIKAMVETGSRIVFEEPASDVHSVGGVPGNSKVALITVPIVAASGLLIPKTSSRAITSPAGTADTVEVLARVDLTIDEIKEIVKKTKGVLAWGGRLNLAPADDIFVNIERRLAIDPIYQMVASILSKKIAMGIERLVIDIPTGRGAKVQEVSKADEMAGVFIRQASKMNVNIRVAVTYGGQPIGMTTGPALEAREALSALMTGKGSRSLVDKAILLAGLVLELGGRVPQGAGEDVAREIFLSGKAYEKFKQIIEAQGGDPSVKPDEIPVGKHSYTLTSPIEGAVTHLDNAAISTLARACGAPYDKGAGVQLHAKVGYRVNKGDPLITLYSNSASRLETAINLISQYHPVIVEGMLLKTLP